MDLEITNIEDNLKLKSKVKDYWNESACGTHLTNIEKYTKEYFDDIEETRYKMQPEIPLFADFKSCNNKKLLEIGVGAGTDFLQWVRNGALAYGIDLTEEAIDHVKHRLSLYNLEAVEYKTADCENLPYDDNTFNIIYSWGVIHHTPNTSKAFDEIVRVLKPGGKAKVMIYHKNSILAYLFWFKHSILKLKPFRSMDFVLSNYMESPGTKAYTITETKNMLIKHKLLNLKINPVLTYYDKLERFNPFMQKLASILSKLLGGNKVGWFLLIEFEK